MPLQNRVDPWGGLQAVSERGAWMGNRGCLHDAGKRLGASRWTRKQWVICKLEFNGRQRELMAPGKYTELFFLDEATALSAGHRPCNTCRRDSLRQLLDAWRTTAGSAANLEDLDSRLHAERAAVVGLSALPVDRLGVIPDGCFVADTQRGDSLLLWKRQLLRWSFGGYTRAQPMADDREVTLISPPVMREIIAAGYEPQVHASVMDAVDAAHLSAAPTLQVARLQRSLDIACGGEMPMYRLAKTPSGKELHAYFAAVLQVTGMDSGGSFPLKKFLGNFSGHLEAGRIVKAEDGGYRLTPSGKRYFDDRFDRWNPQNINQLDVDRFKQGIRGGGAGWVPVK